ncbi:hypothetical protein BJ322DRAFT_169425 [Thelephora terrestris]|uniref:Uncharacterized protein n=1 Tax=Thelephora terrestris TaxID=56493 RepID=A0A9P6HA15_9AGAM|nr:hypothetical protein BJ322DRAFT_169425 [Thelephora terrestris]
MGWRRPVRVPPPHQRPLGTRDIATVLIIYCSVLVLWRLRFSHSISAEPSANLERTHRRVRSVRGVDPTDCCELRALRRSGYGLTSTSGGFDSGRKKLAFKEVVEHIHGMVLAGTGRRRRYAGKALEILLTLAKKTPFPLFEVAWINGLLGDAADGDMNNDTFILFLKLRALTMGEDVEPQPDQDFVHVQDGEMDRRPPGGAVASAEPTPEHPLLTKISWNVKICSDRAGGWQDEAVYGGLIAIKDIPNLRTLLPQVWFIKTLADAMEKDKPFSVRRAAYDVVQVAQGGWLKSSNLEFREALKKYDFPRKLHGVVLETGRSDHQLSFLKMMEILSEDRSWHSYLRGAMGILLDFRHEGSHLVTQILRRVGEISSLEHDYNLPLDSLLVKMVEDEWARVPGRRAMDLSADLLEPLAEVTTQLKEILFTEPDRRAVLAVVERVIPSLEKRRDDGYGGPGTDVCDIIDRLRVGLGKSTPSTSRRSSYWLTK